MEFRAKLLRPLFTIFPISGVFCLLFSITSAFRSYQFITQGLRIEGEVIDLSVAKQPVIKFLPSEKTKMIEFRTSGAVNYKVGDRLTILFLKDDKSSFMVDTPGSLFSDSLSIGVMGIMHLTLIRKLRRACQ